MHGQNHFKQASESSITLCTYGFCQKVALNRGDCVNFVCKELAGALQILFNILASWSCWKESNGLGILLPSFNA
jgi:hypothetical protein